MASQNTQIWSEFERPRQRRESEQATCQADRQTCHVDKFRIETLAEKEWELALNLLVDLFLKHEPTCCYSGVGQDPIGVQEIIDYWQKCLSMGTSLACYHVGERGKDLLIGLNVCSLRTKDESPTDLDKIRSPSWRQVLETLVLAEGSCDIYEELGVERYLGASGLLVLPSYRGLRIGAEILKAREPLCRELGLRATATVFTALASQKLAAHCGYRLLGELKYASLEDRGILYPGIPTPSAKVMGRTFN